MSSEKQITLPVMGMTCANCVASVERNARKATGVTGAAVNFASEKVTFTYDPALIDGKAATAAVIERVKRAGYEIPTATLELPLLGMTCANCAANIERALNKVDGVLEAAVNYASEKATVTYAPGAAARGDLIAAVRKAGYDVVESADADELEDAEAAARAAELRHQQMRFLVGVLFSLPLFVLSMGRDFGLLGAWAHAPWVNWLFWAWRRRSSFTSAGTTTWAGRRACATAAPTWTCWWRWGRRWPTCTAWRCCWRSLLGQPRLGPPRLL
jgi:P-type Cu+ transporter